MHDALQSVMLIVSSIAVGRNPNSRAPDNLVWEGTICEKLLRCSQFEAFHRQSVQASVLHKAKASACAEHAFFVELRCQSEFNDSTVTMTCG